MDFRDWKKVSDDGKMCTLEHPKGHRLTVAMRGLSSIHREQLKRLKLAKGGAVKRYADGTPDGPVSNDDSSDQAPSAGGTHITINAAPAAAPALPQMAQAVNPAAQLAKQPLQVAAPAPVQGASNLNPSGQPNPAAISKNAQLIPQAQRDIDISQSQAEGKNLGQYSEALGQVEQQRQEKYNNLAGHVDDFAKYMEKNPIDPKHYQENMGAGAKTATAIGLFFGGLGTPFGGHNYAMDFLNKQIDRDIEGQKSRADQQKTIYGAYRDLYGEGKEALAATKATMLDIMNSRQKMIAAQLGTPQAYQKSLALSNQLAISKQKELSDAATPLSALPGFNSGAKDTQGAPPPGVGVPPQANQPNPNSMAQPPVAKPQAAMSPDDTMRANARRVSGLPPEEAQQPKDAASDSPRMYTILSPNAQQHLDNLRYTPKAKDELDQIKQQYTQAQQAEKVLNGPKGDGVGGIHDLMQNMYQNIGGESAISGAGTHVRRAIESAASSIPMVGSAIEAATELYPKGEAYKQFQSNRTTMETDLATALNGLVPPSDINRIVEANLPAYMDSPKDIDRKEQAIVNMVLKASKTSLLNDWNLTKKQ